MRDTPVAIDVTQSDCQPEQAPLPRRAAEGIGAAPDDPDREGDIFAGGNYVERLQRLVTLEEEIPVLIHSSNCSGAGTSNITMSCS